MGYKQNELVKESTLSDISLRGSETSAAQLVSNLSEQDIMDAMTMARTILLDVEEALKNIGEDEAEEIAEVGLTVAKMFLWSLQNIHGKFTPQMVSEGINGVVGSTGSNSTVEIEILDDDDFGMNGSGDGDVEEDYTDLNQDQNGEINTAPEIENNEQKQANTKVKGRGSDRIRVLWPPIGPAVASAASWSREAAVKNPILSIALAMALWPAALIGAFIGAPLLAADWALQSGYNAIQDQPLVENVERGASNLFQVGKLYYLCSKLVVKQGLRVGKRQVERRGSVGKIVQDLGYWTVDRAMHPLETAGMAWNSLKFGAGAVVDGTNFVKDIATGKVSVGGVSDAPLSSNLH